MDKNQQYIAIGLIVLAVLLVVFSGGTNKFNYELPDFGLHEEAQDDFQFALDSGAEGLAWNPDVTLRALTMIDGSRPLGEWELRRISVFGLPDNSAQYLVKATSEGEFIPVEYETTVVDVGNTLDLSEFKVSSQKAFDKAHKKAQGIEANPEDKVTINLTLIDDNGRLVWNYLLIVQRANFEEGEPAGEVLFVTMDARSGRIINEQRENL